MTPEELRAKVEIQKAHGREHLYLTVDRLPSGERMRVLPGVMGRVCAVTGDNRTTVVVKVSDVERALNKAAEQSHA